MKKYGEFWANSIPTFFDTRPPLSGSLSEYVSLTYRVRFVRPFFVSTSQERTFHIAEHCWPLPSRPDFTSCYYTVCRCQPLVDSSL